MNESWLAEEEADMDDANDEGSTVTNSNGVGGV